MQQGGSINAPQQRAGLLAKRHASSSTRAQGFLDGEMARRRGSAPSTYVRVGMDEYCMGFRAGYFVRGASRRNDFTQWLARPLESQAAIALATASLDPSAQLQNRGTALAALR